jgi:hypothetical protein
MVHKARSAYLTKRTLLIGGATLLTLCTPLHATGAEPKSSIADLQRFLGTWRGEGYGKPGHSQVERTYEMMPGNNFILVRNTSTYAPQEKNPKGEIHTDVGYFSFDKTRKVFVLRQFHLTESFVNQYSGSGFVGNELILNSEAIENIPTGWRARETYRFADPDQFEEIFELSGPREETFEVYSHNKLQRA